MAVTGPRSDTSYAALAMDVVDVDRGDRAALIPGFLTAYSGKRVPQGAFSITGRVDTFS